MPKFTVKLMQFVEEVCEITVEADSIAAARAEVEDSIKRGMADSEYYLDWSDGSGTHEDGIEIYEVKGAS